MFIVIGIVEFHRRHNIVDFIEVVVEHFAAESGIFLGLFRWHDDVRLGSLGLVVQFEHLLAWLEVGAEVLLTIRIRVDGYLVAWQGLRRRVASIRLRRNLFDGGGEGDGSVVWWIGGAGDGDLVCERH